MLWRSARADCGLSAVARPAVDNAVDLVTLARIKEQSRLSLGFYGRPRMTEDLKEIGLDVGPRRVGLLVRQNGISVVRTRKHKVTTGSEHKFNIAPNLLDRDFKADQPNQKWAGDISYVWTREGWLYLAVILDLHSRRVIGWAVSNRMKRDLAIRALKMAIAFGSPPKGCIHHTDRNTVLMIISRSCDSRASKCPCLVRVTATTCGCRDVLQNHQS